MPSAPDGRSPFRNEAPLAHRCALWLHKDSRTNRSILNSSWRIAALVATGLGMLFMSTAGVSPAAAAYPDRATALNAFQSSTTDQAVDAGWTGSVSGCSAGTESAGSLAATLNTVNVLRSFAGVDPVELDSGMNRDALAAALMVRASGQ